MLKSFQFGKSNSGRTSISNSNFSGPSSGSSTAVGSNSGSLIATKSSDSVIWDMLSKSSEPRTWSATSFLNRCSTSLRGARPGRKPGTLADPIKSLNALS